MNAIRRRRRDGGRPAWFHANAHTRAGRGTGAGRGGGGRTEPRRSAPGGRPLSAAARRARNHGARNFRCRRRAAAEGVTSLKVGERGLRAAAGRRLCGICVGFRRVRLPIPKASPLATPAACRKRYFTVWTNVFDSARLKTGETFLVHGGSSGIGTAAIQLCMRAATRCSRRRATRKMRAHARVSAPRARSTTARRISSPW